MITNTIEAYRRIRWTRTHKIESTSVLHQGKYEANEYIMRSLSNYHYHWPVCATPCHNNTGNLYTTFMLVILHGSILHHKQNANHLASNFCFFDGVSQPPRREGCAAPQKYTHFGVRSKHWGGGVQVSSQMGYRRSYTRLLI